MHRTTIKVNGEWDRQAVIRVDTKVAAILDKQCRSL